MQTTIKKDDANYLRDESRPTNMNEVSICLTSGEKSQSSSRNMVRSLLNSNNFGSGGDLGEINDLFNILNQNEIAAATPACKTSTCETGKVDVVDKIIKIYHRFVSSETNLKIVKKLKKNARVTNLKIDGEACLLKNLDDEEDDEISKNSRLFKKIKQNWIVTEQINVMSDAFVFDSKENRKFLYPLKLNCSFTFRNCNNCNCSNNVNICILSI
jgi:hypothetical protein